MTGLQFYYCGLNQRRDVSPEGVHMILYNTVITQTSVNLQYMYPSS
jgi:hypothetical protein